MRTSHPFHIDNVRYHERFHRKISQTILFRSHVIYYEAFDVRNVRMITWLTINIGRRKKSK